VTLSIQNRIMAELMRLYRNNVNAFPHSTFNWVGIDGTQVLCHMTPVGTALRSFPVKNLVDLLVHASDTYNAQATAGDISKALTNHKVTSIHSIFRH
jgi:alpha-mannosidase